MAQFALQHDMGHIFHLGWNISWTVLLYHSMLSENPLTVHRAQELFSFLVFKAPLQVSPEILLLGLLRIWPALILSNDTFLRIIIVLTHTHALFLKKEDLG